MSREIRVVVLMTPEEYFLLKHLAHEDCRSQGGEVRYLIKREAASRALSMDDSDAEESAEPAQVLPMRGTA